LRSAWKKAGTERRHVGKPASEQVPPAAEPLPGENDEGESAIGERGTIRTELLTGEPEIVVRLETGEGDGEDESPGPGKAD
jgi:hypothetical protein